MARLEKIRLGELLVNQKLITQEQLDLALGRQRGTGRKLGRVLVEAGFVTEEQIAEALARQLGIPFVDLRHFPIRAEDVQRLPETFARRFRALVLENRKSGVRLAMADPTDLFAYDELAKVLPGDIELAVVTESQILAAIDRYYRRTQEISNFAQALSREIAQNEVDFAAVLGAGATVEDAPVVKMLQSIFEDATQVRASDIHIEPQATRLVIRFRIDGVLYVQTETDVKVASALVQRLKLVSGLDISEKRLPQDGRFNIRVRNAHLDVRISTLPTQYGESVVMRLLNQERASLGLAHIGMQPEMLARLRWHLAKPSGLILVTGPTGSGKTTTLYSALTELNDPSRKIITIEDPVEYRLPGLTQVQINEKIGFDFARVLRTTLRQDPDIILVGEMRDRETAEIGLRAAMTGHLVFSTLHTNDAVSTPVRLVDMGVAPFMVAMSLQLVIAQRLVRLICESCKRPEPLEPQEREWLRLELGDEVDRHTYYKGAGCAQCNGTGYAGRTGVYEMLEMNRSLIEALSHESGAAFVRRAWEQMAGRTLRHDAVRLVLEGRTTVAQAMHVSSEMEED